MSAWVGAVEHPTWTDARLAQWREHYWANCSGGTEARVVVLCDEVARLRALLRAERATDNG